MIVDEWKGCYPSSWKGIITPESFSHPAKASSKLAERIYKHAIAEGWLHEGSRVVDPFGGIGGFAFHAMLNGMDMTLVELEPKFVALAQANIDMWNARYKGKLPHFGTARIIQGDSRHLAQVIGAAEACISSPPFNEDKANVIYGQTKGFHSYDANEAKNRMKRDYLLPSTPGNLGNLPPGNVDAVISSPPYADQSEGVMRADKFKDPAAFAESQRHKGHGSSFEAKLRSMEKENERASYGSTPGQLASLPPGAPPFEGCVSIPPFEDSIASDDRVGNAATYTGHKAIEYAPTEGNLGNTDTFWSAAREIVAQVYAVLAPGAHAIWVVKSYVKNKQLVDFPHQWQTLCESVGFVTLHEHHALLVRHGATSIDIDGNHHEKKTESKSFFRRLAEKNGSPRIDFETVLCMVKPGGEGGGWDGAISSPPFTEDHNRQDKIRAHWNGKGGDGFLHAQGYAQAEGNLGSLPPGSPPDTRHGEGG